MSKLLYLKEDQIKQAFMALDRLEVRGVESCQNVTKIGSILQQAKPIENQEQEQKKKEE